MKMFVAYLFLTLQLLTPVFLIVHKLYTPSLDLQTHMQTRRG